MLLCVLQSLINEYMIWYMRPKPLYMPVKWATLKYCNKSVNSRDGYFTDEIWFGSRFPPFRCHRVYMFDSYRSGTWLPTDRRSALAAVEPIDWWRCHQTELFAVSVCFSSNRRRRRRSRQRGVFHAVAAAVSACCSLTQTDVRIAARVHSEKNGHYYYYYYYYYRLLGNESSVET